MADDIDDLLSDFGLDLPPANENDQFYATLTNGKYSKIDTMRYWLVGEMSKFHFYKEEGIKVSKLSSKNTQTLDRPLTNLEFARANLKFYLMQYHLTWFLGDGMGGTGKACDFDIVLDKIVAHARIREVIEKIPD